MRFMFFLLHFFFFSPSDKDVSDLELPTGDTLILMEFVGELQAAKGGGSLCTTQDKRRAEVPRLSTVVLHRRPQQQQQHNAQHRTEQAANGQEGGGGGGGGGGREGGTAFTTTRSFRKGAVPAVEQRRLFLQHHQWERASRQRTLGLAERSCVRFDSSEMSKPTALSD